MRKFLNLSFKESKGLDKSIYKNAQKLKQDAILIAENRESYGTATSLLILSTEECVKSILVLLHSEEYNIYKVKDAKKFFSDHVIRHQIAMLIEASFSFYESWNQYKERKPTTLFKNSWIGSALNMAIDISNVAKPVLNAKVNVEYLQEFNDIKNKGFYVDYRDGLIIPIKEVTIEDYNKSLKIANRVLKFNKLLRILFHEKIENHMRKEKIKEAKKYIKEFIDDGMKVVSFDELKKKSL
jgi:AbiV family abortive infection protein